MTVDERAALVLELASKPVKVLLAMVIVELIEVRDVLDQPLPQEPAGCPHPEDRRVAGGMGTGIVFHCLECGHEERS